MSKEKQAPSPLGSSFESFLVEAGIRDETVEYAVKAVFAWQLDEVRKARGLSKKQFADLLGTSRSQLDRVLDPDNEGVTIETLKKAAHILGKKVHLELVDETRLVEA
jgi:DNA-binding Xre family transcriptional regulator